MSASKPLRALKIASDSVRKSYLLICAMERLLFAEVLGTDVRLAGCRLEGQSECTFELN